MHHSMSFQFVVVPGHMHKANTSQAMSCLPNVLDYIQIVCACGHTLLFSSCFVICPLHQCSSPSWQQWCRTEDHQGQPFQRYITFSNRWLRTGITLKQDGFFFKKVSGNKLWALWNTPGQFLDWKPSFQILAILNAVRYLIRSLCEDTMATNPLQQFWMFFN